jgi:hypothetical protein
MLAQRMVTHADLANATISRSQFDALAARVVELERGSVSTIWGVAVKLAAGVLSMYAVVELVRKVAGH